MACKDEYSRVDSSFHLVESLMDEMINDGNVDAFRWIGWCCDVMDGEQEK